MVELSWTCYFLSVGKPVIAIKVGMLAITQKTDLKSALIRSLSTIQSSNHELVEVLGLVYLTDGPYPARDAEDLERKLHVEFVSQCRFKTGTRGAEWFNSTIEIIEKVRRISVSPDQLGLPRTVGVLP